MPDSTNAIACPKCGSTQHGIPVTYALWGGFLGPKLLSHVKCPQCGQAYNGKTGQLNTRGIVLFITIPILLALIVAFVVLKMH